MKITTAVMEDLCRIGSNWEHKSDVQAILLADGKWHEIARDWGEELSYHYWELKGEFGGLVEFRAQVYSERGTYPDNKLFLDGPISSVLAWKRVS